MFAWIARTISGVRAEWVNCEPPSGQAIFIANHASHLDFLLLWAALPRQVRDRTRPVAARDYWERNGLRRFLASRVFRAVLIDRSGSAGRHVLEPLHNALTGNDSLILFPEGTRGTGQIGEFHSGLFHLCAKHDGLEVRPVYLENLNRVLPKGEFLMVPLLMRVVFGPGFKRLPGETKQDFLTRARNAVVDLSRY